MDKRLFRIPIFVIFFVSISFLCCRSNSDTGDDYDVVKTLYTLNATGGDGKEYHFVKINYCTDTGDDTFEVLYYDIHWFSTENPKYKNMSGAELMDLAKSGSVKPDIKFSETLERNFTTNSIDYDDGKQISLRYYNGRVYNVSIYY